MFWMMWQCYQACGFPVELGYFYMAATGCLFGQHIAAKHTAHLEHNFNQDGMEPHGMQF